jgi:hypothetical protein
MRAGIDAAVKIQYPGIRAAIENDFRWIRNLSMPARASGHLPKAALDEMESQIMHEQFAIPGRKLAPATRRAISDFALRFYRKVYPPDPEEAERPFDFSNSGFLRDYLRAGSNLTRAKGVAPHYIFLARAEIGLYNTLHRLKARVHTSPIVRRLLTTSRKEGGTV